jgi:hypothetical protein
MTPTPKGSSRPGDNPDDGPSYPYSFIVLAVGAAIANLVSLAVGGDVAVVRWASMTLGLLSLILGIAIATRSRRRR